MTDSVIIVVESEKDDLEIVGVDGSDDEEGGMMDVDGLKCMVKIMVGGECVCMFEGLNYIVVEVFMKARLFALVGLFVGWM